MPINRNMVLKDPMNHDMPVEYHVINTIVVHVEENTTEVIIASYQAKGQYEWKKESFVKPPMALSVDGVDKTIDDIEAYIITLPEWKGATIVV